MFLLKLGFLRVRRSAGDKNAGIQKAIIKYCKAISESGSDAVREAFETPGYVIPNRYNSRLLI